MYFETCLPAGVRVAIKAVVFLKGRGVGTRGNLSNCARIEEDEVQNHSQKEAFSVSFVYSGCMYYVWVDDGNGHFLPMCVETSALKDGWTRFDHS